MDPQLFSALQLSTRSCNWRGLLWSMFLHCCSAIGGPFLRIWWRPHMSKREVPCGHVRTSMIRDLKLSLIISWYIWMIFHNDIIINVIQQIQKRFPMSPTLSFETCAFSSRQTFIEKPEAGTPGHRSAYKHARLMIHVTWTNLWGVFRLGVLPKITKKMTIAPSVWVWL